MKKLLAPFVVKLFGMSLLRGYLTAVLVSALPIFVMALCVTAFVGHTNGSIDKIDQQVAAAKTVDGKVSSNAVTARADDKNIVPAWVIIDLLLVIIGGGFIRKSLGLGTMLATNQLVSDARAAASGDFRVAPNRWF